MSYQIDREKAPISDPKAVECNRKLGLVEFGATSVAVVAGGLLMVVSFVTPTRALGGTRSARLQWQQQAQVQSDSAAADKENTKEGSPNETTKDRL